MTKRYGLTKEQMEALTAVLGNHERVVSDLEAIKNGKLSDDEIQEIATRAARMNKAEKATGNNGRRTFNPADHDAQVDTGLGDVSARDAAMIIVGQRVRRAVAAQLRARGIENSPLLKPDEDLDAQYNAVNQRAAEMANDGVYSPSSVRSNQGDAAFTECGIDFAWNLVEEGSSILSLLDSKPTKNGKLKWRLVANLIESWGMSPSQDCDDLNCTPSGTYNIEFQEEPAKLFKSAGCVNRVDVEDAFWDIIGEMTDQMLADAGRTRQFNFLRGDMTLAPTTTNYNHYGQTPTAPAGVVPAYAHFDGIMHSWLVDNPAQNGNNVYWDEDAGPAAEANTPEGFFTTGDPLTYAHIQQLRNLMHDALVNRALGFGSRVIAMMTPGLYAQLSTLDELVGQCCGNGPATTGVLPNVGGIPQFWSEHMPLTDQYGRVMMTAPETPDVAANIYHSYQLIHLDSFVRGEASDLELMVELEKDCEIIKPILRWRETLGRRSSTAAATGIEGVAGIAGISLS